MNLIKLTLSNGGIPIYIDRDKIVAFNKINDSTNRCQILLGYHTINVCESLEEICLLINPENKLNRD